MNVTQPNINSRRRTEFYRKEVSAAGEETFVKVSEYDSELINAFPVGSCIQVVVGNSTIRRYNVDPAIAPMVAASMLLADKMTDIISEAARYKIKDNENGKIQLTQEQQDAWEALNKAFDGNLSVLRVPSIREIADSVLDVISQKAKELLNNESVKEAYEHFLLVCKLTRSAEKSGK